MLHRQGNLTQALRGYDQVLAIDPDNVDALHLRGVIAQQQGRADESIRLISRAILLNPRIASFYSNLGNAHRDLGRMTDAEAAYRSALRIDPNYVDAMINLAALFILTENFSQSLEWSEKALTYGPHAHALCYRGVAKKNRGELEEARKDLESSTRLNPNLAQAWTNLGNVYRDLLLYDLALEAQNRAIKLQPNFAEAFNNRGYILKQMDRPQEALADYNQALKLKPDFVGASWNKSMILLHDEEWIKGFELYEFRRLKKGAFKLDAPIREWQGEPLENKRIVIYSEQGIGDLFQFIRLIDRLVETKAAVSLSCLPSLHKLLKSWARDRVNLIGFNFNAKDYDYQSSLMSLPQKLKLQTKDITSSSAYLDVDRSVVEKWHSKLKDPTKLKVGICWQGNPQFPEDKLRSIPLKALEPLLENENADFYSLQKGFGSEQLSESKFADRIIDFTSDFDRHSPDSFIDAAGLIKNLDLVISIDSAIAHLSGALGARTKILLPYVSDWRWGRAGKDRPWYRSVELVRQDRNLDWSSAIHKLK